MWEWRDAAEVSDLLLTELADPAYCCNFEQTSADNKFK